MIRKGKEYVESKGRSLFYHYKEAQKIIWPREDHHRWSDLILSTACDNEVSTILGCSDSCKTWSISKFALTDYWCFPDSTLWLISTTEGRGSELRIWGAIKDLFNEGRRQVDWLAGNPVDYLKTITTDEIDSEKREARSLRRGLIVIPCFPSGTLVDTPTGTKRIEQLRVGDIVLNAVGGGRVKEIHSRISVSLVRVRLSDGRSIDCTEEHPFFTNRGWVKAVDLSRYDEVFSSNETVRLLRKKLQFKRSYKKVLLGRLQNLRAIKTMRAMRGIFPSVQSKERQISQWPFLWNGLRWQMGNRPQSSQNDYLEMQNLRKVDGVGSFHPQILFDRLSQCAHYHALRILRKGVRVNSGSTREETEAVLQSILCMERDAPSKTKEGHESDPGRVNSLEDVPGGDLEPSSQKRATTKEWIKKLVQDRRSFFRPETGCGDRRWRSSNSESYGERQGENGNLNRAWVDRVEILESRGDKRFDPSKGGYTVYNLEVEGHPSYSVNGVIVHNCKPGSIASGLAPYIGIKSGRLRHAGDETQVMGESHLNAYANWYGKEDFKGINAGNFMETDDPLGIAAEPENGWDSFEDTGKTQTWRGKFYRAAVVALDGRDSPNFDYPEQPNGRRRFPYMISKKKLDAVAETKGTNSWEWYSQCIGKPVKGMDIWRVLRKDFCQKHKAMDDVIWKGTPRTSMYSIDPAYGLGDRCVGRKLEFGEGIDGNQILLAHSPEIIPIAINTGIDAESQIAAFIYSRLDQLSIPPQNCFYDSFGRGTLGFSFSKVFGSVCPVPVDSGAQPSSRPVRFDLFVEERNGVRRLKRCDEHYTKFISELWFSVCEAIESEQMRGIDIETIREGCARKFTRNAHNKIEVEPKEDMKERLKRSPDLMDNLAIGVEGARRLGFKIQRLVAEEEEQEDTRWQWFKDMQNRQAEIRKKHSLSFR